MVEFLQPDQHYAPPLSGPGSSQDEPIQPHPGHLVLESDDPDSELDDFITTSSSVTLPFLAPMQPIFLTPQARQYYQASKSSNSKGKEPAAGPPGTAIPEKQIYHALKKSIIQVFGDAGWGKVGNSLAGEISCLVNRSATVSLISFYSQVFLANHLAVYHPCSKRSCPNSMGRADLSDSTRRNPRPSSSHWMFRYVVLCALSK